MEKHEIVVASADAIYAAIRDMPSDRKGETVTAEFAEHYNRFRDFALQAMPEYMNEAFFPPKLRIVASAQVGSRFTESYYVDVAAYALDIRNRAIRKNG